MVQGGPLRGDEDNHPPAGNLLAYRQSLSEDHTFLKVLGIYMIVMIVYSTTVDREILLLRLRMRVQLKYSR